MSESIPVVLKRRAECPMCQNDWHVTESLRAERDTARGEAEDFRRAWAILREDENQRMPATAEEGARQFRAEFDAARADLEKAHEEIKRLSIEALKAGNRAHNELAETQRDLEKARAEGARLRGALEALVAGVEDSVLRFLETHELRLRHDMEHVLHARIERARAALSEAP